MGGITSVRDEEKVRYDRKSLALSPLPPLLRPETHKPQHSGLPPPAWTRSPLFSFGLCVCLRDFPFSYFLSLPCPSSLSFTFAALILSVSHFVFECSDLRLKLKHVLPVIHSVFFPLCYYFISSVLSLYFYNFVFFVAAEFPTSVLSLFMRPLSRLCASSLVTHSR